MKTLAELIAESNAADKVHAVTDMELDLLEKMIAAAFQPQDIEKLQPDPAGFYWSRERNALQHLADPWMLARLCVTVRALRAAVGAKDSAIAEALEQVEVNTAHGEWVERLRSAKSI